MPSPSPSTLLAKPFLACAIFMLHFFGNICSQDKLPTLGLLAMANTILMQGSTTPNFGSLKVPFEQLCSRQPEYFVESDGRDSSVMLEFNPHNAEFSANASTCVRILSAPKGYDFIVRLIVPKWRLSKPAAKDASKRDESADSDGAKSAELNSTTGRMPKKKPSCPLTFFSSAQPDDPQWQIDPCQLEDVSPGVEDPMRLLSGRVRIVWQHNHHVLNSKLMVTTFAKGERRCKGEHKHQCLKVGEDPILCISKDLTCDGVRHCPYSAEYDSDEDYAMCWESRQLSEPMPTFINSALFEHMTIELLRSLFAHDVPTGPVAVGSNTTTTSTTEASVSWKNYTVPSAPSHHNSTRLRSDMSKYGPWGYLMMGVLVCGAAILVCGLWITAAQSNQTVVPLENAAGAHSGLDHSEANAPPDYEELDPPPAYSVLFPNQKSAAVAALEIVNEAASSAAAEPLATPSAGITPAPTAHSSTTVAAVN